MRRARPSDALGMARVHVLTWQEAYAHVFPRDRLATLSIDQRAELGREILAKETPPAATFVAEHEGEIVAFASVGAARDADASEATGELYAIYVLPAAWGRGAGRALMDAALQSLRNAGYEDAVLWVLEDNPRTRRFYELGGWALDSVTRTGEHLGVTTKELRYRTRLE